MKRSVKVSKRHSLKVFIAAILIPAFLLISIPTNAFALAPTSKFASSQAEIKTDDPIAELIRGYSLKDTVLAFDIDGTLNRERHGKLDDGVVAKFIELLEKGANIQIITGKSRDELYEYKILDPLIDALRQKGKIDLIKGTVIYGSDGGGRFIFNKNGDLALDRKYSNPFTPKEMKIIEEVVEAMAGAFKKAYGVKPFCRNFDNIKYNFSPYGNEKEDVLHYAFENDPAEMAKPPSSRKKSREEIAKELIDKLHERGVDNIDYIVSGKTTIGLVRKGVDKDKACNDIFSSFPHVKRVIYVGDEITKGNDVSLAKLAGREPRLFVVSVEGEKPTHSHGHLIWIEKTGTNGTNYLLDLILRKVADDELLAEYERRAAGYVAGEIQVPASRIGRMLRLTDLAHSPHIDLMSITREERSALLRVAAEYFRKLKQRNGKIAVAILASGAAARMKKGDYLPPLLKAAQRDEPDRFGRIGDENLPKAKALLPAAKIGDRWMTFLDVYLINIQRMNDEFEGLGLGRPFLPKILSNELYQKDIVAGIERGNRDGIHNIKPEDILFLYQRLGYRVAATPEDVEAKKDEFNNEGDYAAALRFAQEHKGEVLVGLGGAQEGHGEYWHAHFETVGGQGEPLYATQLGRGVEYDAFRNIDNMAPLNEDWLVIFGNMLKHNLTVSMELSKRPKGKVGKGGGFVISEDGYPQQMEDDVYNASAKVFGFDREGDEKKENPEKNNPTPVNNATGIIKFPEALNAAYGLQGVPGGDKKALFDIGQKGRSGFRMVPVFKVVNGPNGRPIGTILFETRVWDIWKGNDRTFGVARVPSTVDVDEELIGDNSQVRFDPLKEKPDYDNESLQRARAALSQYVMEGALLSDEFTAIADDLFGSNWNEWASAEGGDLNEDMFRDYDYRSVGPPLKPEVVFRLGLAWAEMALDKAKTAGTTNRKVLVARDARKIEPGLIEVLVSALRYAGLDVVYISADGPNAVTSYSWAAQEHRPLMSIFSTASHVSEPKDRIVRGFKVAMLNKEGRLQSLTRGDIRKTKARIKALMEDPAEMTKVEAEKKGAFARSKVDANCVRMCALVGNVAASGGSLYKLADEMQQPGSSPIAVLSEWERPFDGAKPLAGIRVVVEGAHTPSGKLAADTFKKLGVDVRDAILINGDVKEVEGEHTADPSRDENLRQLKETIQKENADFGIAFDLDGDRGAIVVPIRGGDGQIRFETLGPDNLMVAMLPYLIKECGYNPKVIDKKIGVIRDVLGTFGVNDRAEELAKELEAVVEVFQTDSGYVFLKAERQRLLREGYTFPIYGERSGHCWLEATGEFENPIAVAALFAVMVKKAKYDETNTAKSRNPFWDTYTGNTIPYMQSTRFQPWFHPKFLAELSAHSGNKTGWRYDPAKSENPPQVIIALGKDEAIKRLKREFAEGKSYNTPAGSLVIKEFNAYQDIPEEGGLYRFADIVFELDGKFAGRFMFRASSNDPTFVASFETPVWEGEANDAQTVHDRYVSIGGLVLDWLERNNIAIVTGGEKYPNKEATEPVVFEYRRRMKIAVGVESILSLLGLQSINRQMDVLYGRARDEVKGLSPRAEHMAEIGFETKDGKKINRLGWTPANLRRMLGSEDMQRQIAGVIKDAEAIRGRYKYVIFCGMGGSGLSVQTVKTTFGEPEGLKIFSLRTTDPAVIKDILDEITKDAGGSLEEALKNTLWIPISKSGTTEETVSHKKYAEVLYGKFGINIKNHMWVMTDKGSKMDTLDYEQRFIQLNDGIDIGGRFTSPTTRVFLLPLALVAPDRVMAILEAARRMNEAEDKDIDKDPFMVLGAYLYDMAANMGRDKVTFIVPDELRDLPLWSEELFEESLGKGGKGVTIFYGEELSEASLRSIEENDRVFVRINMTGRKTNEKLWNHLEGKGYPVFEIDMDDINSIGGVMLGLQRTIAVIGYLWDICFVDQPAVEGYKNATREVMKLGEKVEVPKEWKSVAFGKLKLYYDRLIEAGAFSIEELEVAVKGLGADMGNAPAVYAAIINILKSKPRFEAKEFASYGRMTQRMQAVLQQARTAIFTNTLRMPSKLGEGPDKNHSYQENIEGGKDMWFSTYFMPLHLEQPAAPALEYDENRIKAQTIGTVNSIVKNRRKVALITFDSTTKGAEEDVRLFFAEVERYLAPVTTEAHSEATNADPLLVGRIINEVVSGRPVADEMASLFNLLNQAEKSRRDTLIDTIKERLDRVVGDFSEADRAVAKERADAFKVELYKFIAYFEMMEEGESEYTVPIFVVKFSVDESTARRALDELSDRRNDATGIFPGIHKVILPDGNVVYRKIQTGDTIAVQLPQGRQVVFQAVAATGQAEPVTAQPPQTAAKKRILRVDDDEDVCEGDKDILEFKGYEVVTCLNGQAALDRFKQDRGNFDLIIADGRMPVMGGIELVKAIRALEFGKRVPVIMVTAGLSESEQAEAQSLRSKGDIFDMLTKPVSYQWFIDRVTEALSKGAERQVILIAEDNPSDQAFYRIIFPEEIYEIIICPNAESALEAFKRERKKIKLVITDKQMPGMDGHWLVDEIRKEEGIAGVPIVMATTGGLQLPSLQEQFRRTEQRGCLILEKPSLNKAGAFRAQVDYFLNTPALTLAGKRALVVDDDPVVPVMVKRFLEKLGCEAVVCGNGQEGLATFQKGSFDLVITDMQMPVMNGAVLVTAINRLNSRVPVIMLTGGFDETEAPQVEGIKDRLVVRLEKPVELGVLQFWVKTAFYSPPAPAPLEPARTGADSP